MLFCLLKERETVSSLNAILSTDRNRETVSSLNVILSTEGNRETVSSLNVTLSNAVVSEVCLSLSVIPNTLFYACYGPKQSTSYTYLQKYKSVKQTRSINFMKLRHGCNRFLFSVN